MTSIPDSHRDLLERPIVVSLATVQPDGQPQVTPVWADLHDGHVRLNTAAGRQKHKNLVDRKWATVMAVDPDNDQRYIEIRGEVSRVSEEDGDAVIDKLANDYLGAESYPFRNPAETRVTFHIKPTRVLVSG
ncbi:MAG TPA: PPOX class F420-dependent oxidoreductase [Thermomicrobiales bacterium]|nr:PPOX class F420-dependent oxidoreductase [Thermomicrobiales bacterium]